MNARKEAGRALHRCLGAGVAPGVQPIFLGCQALLGGGMDDLALLVARQRRIRIFTGSLVPGHGPESLQPPGAAR